MLKRSRLFRALFILRSRWLFIAQRPCSLRSCHVCVQWLKLFVTEYLIKLKQACGAGTESFDSEKYLREREAFGKTIMAWRSIHTIDIYDQSRSGEAIFSVLAGYQQDLAQRRYAIQSPQARPLSTPDVGVEVPPQHDQASPVVWMHDEETLKWIKSMEQQTGQTW